MVDIPDDVLRDAQFDIAGAVQRKLSESLQRLVGIKIGSASSIGYTLDEIVSSEPQLSYQPFAYTATIPVTQPIEFISVTVQLEDQPAKETADYIHLDWED